jgi:hypothetical protein
MNQLVARFLDWFKGVKSSLRFVLAIVLVFAVYAVYRTEHYAHSVLQLPAALSWAFAVAIESMVLGGSAVQMNANLVAFHKRLHGEDGSRARSTVGLARLATAFGLFGLVLVAALDGYQLSSNPLVWVMLVAIQLVQMLFIVCFTALEFIERSDQLTQKWRAEQAAKQAKACKDENRKQRIAASKRECPQCKRLFSLNNYKKHVKSCQSS